MKFWAKVIIVVGIITVAFGVAQPTRAADSSFQLLVKCNTDLVDGGTPNAHYSDPCDVATFFEQFKILAEFGYNITVLLGTGMIIVGGIYFLLAAGRNEMVSRGKSIISGTITGMIIVFTAYIIINYTVSAIAGTKPGSLNPIGILFPNGGQGVSSTKFDTLPVGGATDCKGGVWSWDPSCSTHILCADPEDTGGTVYSYKQKLDTAGCGCGTADTCYGASMTSCVQNFQIANSLPVSGVIDSPTKAMIDRLGTQQTVKTCNEASAQIASLSAKMPTPSLPATGNSSTTGCCVVGGNNPIYCLDTNAALSEQGCIAIGGSMIAGKSCDSVEGKKSCGFCEYRTPPNAAATSVVSCVQFVGPTWCQSMQPAQQTFVYGSCNNDQNCGGSKNCHTTLTLQSPGT